MPEVGCISLLAKYLTYSINLVVLSHASGPASRVNVFSDLQKLLTVAQGGRPVLTLDA